MALIIKKLLKSDNFEKSVKELNEKQLTQVIKHTSDKYYNNTPVISDAQFDYIKDILNNLNPSASVLKEVGAEPKKKKIDLDYWLGSMEKIKPDTGGLEKWQNKYKPPYNISDKLDGVSCLLIYKNDGITMATRGTAEVGTDISNLYEYLNLPSYKKMKEYCSKNNLSGEKNLIAFRGELIMPLEKFNKKWNTFSNPRNTISGIVNSKKLNLELIKDINFVCYEIIDPFYSIDIQLEHIKKIGFKTVSNYNYNKELSYEYLSNVLKDRIKLSEYEIDGIIVTSISNKVRNTKSNPDYAFAYKDIFDIATTTVIKVEWNETKDGYLAPTIIIEPVKLDVEINRVTGIHAKNIVTNNIGKGTILEIIRSGKVIPKVHNIVKSTKPDLPNIKYHWDDTKTNFILDDINSSSKVSIENIYYWFSSMDTKGLGLKNVEKLYDFGFNTVKSIMEAKPADLVLKADLGTKTALNITNAIKEAMSNTTLIKVMASSNKLGRGVGEERIKLVLEKYPNLLTDYKKWSKEKFIANLKEINGWGEEISNLFVKNFSEFIEFYDEIKHLITFKKSIIKSNKIITNKIFVFTGFRDAEIKKKIEEMGGKVAESISSKTNYLVVKSNDEIDNPTTKVSKAIENGTELITKEKLLLMF